MARWALGAWENKIYIQSNPSDFRAGIHPFHLLTQVGQQRLSTSTPSQPNRRVTDFLYLEFRMERNKRAFYLCFFSPEATCAKVSNSVQYCYWVTDTERQTNTFTFTPANDLETPINLPKDSGHRALDLLTGCATRAQTKHSWSWNSSIHSTSCSPAEVNFSLFPCAPLLKRGELQTQRALFSIFSQILVDCAFAPFTVTLWRLLLLLIICNKTDIHRVVFLCLYFVI